MKGEAKIATLDARFSGIDTQTSVHVGCIKILPSSLIDFHFFALKKEVKNRNHD